MDLLCIIAPSVEASRLKTILVPIPPDEQATNSGSCSRKAKNMVTDDNVVEALGLTKKISYDVL